MNDKIMKALEGLKFRNLSSIMDSNVLKKEKIAACSLLADQISSLKPSTHLSSELTSRVIEGLINLCDDNDGDVRAAADESLNRALRVLSEWNVLSVQRELYAVLKKNGSQRCIRTALNKFGALVVKINPCKGRAFAINLIPCLIKLSARPEEAIIETLGKSLEQIWPILGKFANYNQTKEILKAFIINLGSENTVIRRTSAAALVTIVAHSCKSEVFTSFVLNCVIDKVVPVDGDGSVFLIQGVLNALRGILPLLTAQINQSDDSTSYLDKQLQIYELCLHYAVNRDHNVVTAALETLNQLLIYPNKSFKSALLNPSGITRSYIHSIRQSSRLWSRTASEISVAGSLTHGEELLMDDDVTFQSMVIPEQTSYTINRLRSLSASAEDDADSDPESIISDFGSAFISKEKIKEEDCEVKIEDFGSLIPLEFEKEMDVGLFTDPAIPLLFCARRLAAFLLDGTTSGIRNDKFSRVSVKSIAISCLSNVLLICPRLLSVKLTPFSDCEQRISDVLLLIKHADPQLRGMTAILIGSFLSASLIENGGRGVPSLDDDSNIMSIRNLNDLLLKSLNDLSPVTSRLALSAVQICLKQMISSDYHHFGIFLLNILPEIGKNAYWLNKVRLIETLTDLDYVIVSAITKNTKIQDGVFEHLIKMLKDNDGRVRRATAEGIVKIIPKLLVKDSAFVAYSERFAQILTDDFGKKRYTRLHLSLPYCHLQSNLQNELVLNALSNIVSRLTKDLIIYEDKYQLYGILETLRLLSEKYPPVVYTSCWNCNRMANTGISCLLAFLVALVTSNSDVIDLPCLENVTVTIANLYAGYAICAMKTSNFEIASHVPNARWLIFGNDEMGKISEELLTHLLTVLNIYAQLQESPTNLKPHGRILHLLPKKGDKEENSYRIQPHYLKLHQTLRHGYSNYKMCIDDAASEKFLNVLSTTLLGLSAILEICLPTDSARIAEETLSYMRALISIQPDPTLTVTLQLFRSLFGVNLPHFWTGLDDYESNDVDSLYANIFRAPDEFLTARNRQVKNLQNVELKKELCLNPDKMELVSYLKLLEHMIIKALRIYTITPDTDFQCTVLTLLTQMVEENVKYSHLDEQLVFIGFVKKQLELIERGQIINVQKLLPKIFKFFVCLSSEKQKTKPLMTIPDILQLFVDLMACDQLKETHCVPGWMPVVVEVFTTRQLVGEERKETETQREVILANLLRLAMHREIFEILTFIINCDEQASGKVLSAVLSLMANEKIKLEDRSCRKSLAALFHQFPVSVFHPADALIAAIFTEPRDQGEISEMTRWLASGAILLQSLFRLKEETILLRIQSFVIPVDLSSFLSPTTTRPDPLMVLPPSVIFPPAQSLARYVFLSISRTAVILQNNPTQTNELEIVLNSFFVVAFNFLQSGTFHQTANALKNLIQTEQGLVTDVTEVFLQLSSYRPLLTSQYLNLMGLLQCVDPQIWTMALINQSSFNLQMVQRGAVLALADYLCENSWDIETMELLLLAINQVLELYDEAPVKEVLTHVAQQSTFGPILIQAIYTIQFKTAKTTKRALKILRVIHKDHSGTTLRLIITKFLKLPYSALCRLACSQACQRIEYLMLQPHESVLTQLSEEAFQEIYQTLKETNYPSLMNLFQTLEKFYGHFEEEKISIQNFNPEINEQWFYQQIKTKCCKISTKNHEIAPLLLKLSKPFLKQLFSLPDFQIEILADFLANFKNEENFNLAKEAILEKIAFCDESETIWKMAKVLTIFLQVADNFMDQDLIAIVEFSIHCLHKVKEGLMKKPQPNPHIIEIALLCTCALLNQRYFQNWLNNNLNILDSILNDTVAIVETLIGKTNQQKSAINFLMDFLMNENLLPNYLDGILKRMIVLLCRLTPFWKNAVNVPETGDIDAEILNSFAKRIKIIGWTNRAQFEEIWSAFLGGFSQEMSDSSVACQISALEGISILMEQTLLVKCGDPGGRLMNYSRDSSLLNEYAANLPRINENDGFFEDLEAILQNGGYRVGLFSVEHLWSATQLATSSTDSGNQEIAEIGLDLTSCLHFLLDVFSQWTIDVKDEQFLATALKTSLILSDQFTDPSQFRTLLNIAINIDKIFTPTDVPLLPYCILVTAKCISALLPGVEFYEKLKQMMMRSDSPSMKLANIQALLFLVQSPVVYWELQPMRQMGNSMFYVQDNEAITQLVTFFIPFAVEILLQFLVDRCSWSEIYEVYAWTLMTYLLLHYRKELQDERNEFIELLLASLAAHKGSHSAQTTILHGIERLFLADHLDKNHIKKLESIALVLIGQPEPSARRNGYQLLLTASFISKRRINSLEPDPDSLMSAMERLGLLLGRLKRAVPSESVHVAHVLKYLLRDLKPIDVLTKIIQEYLSPHHPYTNILASLLFQIMEDADLGLLQEWVVLSLPGLINNVPFETSSRNLTCLFLSACRDPWLRAVFPLTLTERKNDDFSQLLIIAAIDFYSQLKNEEKEKEFKQFFEMASKNNEIFAEILKAI